jgi:hypothetical protein
MTSSSTEMHNCPRCAQSTTDLVTVDAGMKLILQQNSSGETIPSQVCGSCYNELTSAVSQGVKLRLEAQAKEKNRHMIWKSRVNLVKHARQMMIQKSFSEAAVSYEKYIRVLEMAYDLKPGQLNPDIFGKSSRSKELTVIATTYWDLLRIYDTHPNYRDRMVKTAAKLAEFIPYSPIFPDVIKKAQSFTSSAKNPDIIRDFLRLSNAGGGRCFIATVAYENVQHPILIELRSFRDHYLLSNRYGLRFVQIYYKYSPHIALWLERHDYLKPAVRLGLYLISQILPKKKSATPLIST